jgi:phosphocarrier protein
MLERELTVSNRLGLHARATAKLVQTLRRSAAT